MSIQSVSFGKSAVTKQGNSYNKTDKGKVIGAAFCAGSSWGGIQSLKRTNHYSEFIKELVGTGLTKGKAQKVMKATWASGFVISALLGLGIGAIVDSVVNRIRAAKADKTQQA